MNSQKRLINRTTKIAAATMVAFSFISTAPNNAFAALPKSQVAQGSVGVKFHESAYSRANALAAARDYISTMGFSRSGLISQLKYEGYSTKDATWAVDHLGANWNTQAVRVAKDYLHTMPFSRKGLIGQLVFDGFSSSQATYGAKKAGL